MRLITDYLEDNCINADTCAFADMNQEVTYPELIYKAKQIACAIIPHCLFKEAIVIILPEGINLIAALFGTLLSGNYYILINPESAQSKIENIIKVIKPHVIITEREMVHQICGDYVTESHFRILLLEDVKDICVDEQLIKQCRQGIKDTDVCNITLTSGSTGFSKVVVLTHRDILAGAKSFSNEYGISKNKLLSCHFSAYFAAFSVILFSLVLTGTFGLIGIDNNILLSNKWREMLDRYRINMLTGTPSMFRLLKKSKSQANIDYPNIKQITMVGEPITVGEAKYILAKFPNAKVYNTYGMSECPIIATKLDIQGWLNQRQNPEESGFVPIGRSVEDTDVFVVNNNHKAECNEVGELYIRASVSMSGYFDDLENTERVYCQNPLQNDYREICIRTGDIGYFDEGGYLHHKGRKDLVVKRSGIRIDLAELEIIIDSIQGNKSICVFVEDLNKIIAFYEGHITENHLFHELSKRLTKQIMPDRIVKIEAIPLSQNAKVDRERLKNEARRLFQR